MHTFVRDAPVRERRLSDGADLSVPLDKLAQPVDVDVDLASGDRVDAKNLPGYFTHGLDSAKRLIHDAVELGLQRFVVRLSGDSPAFDLDSCLKRVTVLADAFSGLREEVPPGVRLTVDPFAVALNPDGRWGVRGADAIDYDRTGRLLEQVGSLFGSAGADQLVTLGRVDAEVQRCRYGIDRVGARTELVSFSSNSETSTAYVYLDHGHDTGQKILPGNCEEMLLWALCDVWCGTGVVLVKPLENLHIISRLVHLMDDPGEARRFLTSPRVRQIAARSVVTNEFLSAIEDDQLFRARLAAARVGAYAVSGTTYMLRLLADERGADQARQRLREMWLEALAAMAGRADCIIDRNAMSFQRNAILH